MARKITKKFDWKITAKKAGVSAAVTFLTGLIAYMQNEPAYLVLIPVVEGVKNFIKHYKFK